MNEKKYQIAVIGSGSAGVMSALRGVLNNDEVVLFPGSAKNKKKSRAFWVAKVDNMPGHHEYTKGIDNPNKKTLKWLEECEQSDKFTLMKNRGVDNLEKLEDGTFKIEDSTGHICFAEYVVLCTGIMDVQPKVDGSIKGIFPYANAQTVDYCLRCDGHHTLGKDTSIIGNGIGAAWVAIMLTERYKNPSMTILTNGDHPNFNAEVEELMGLYGIKVITDVIEEVQGLPKEGKLEGFKFVNGEVLKSQFAFISLGTIVYNELASSIGAAIDGRGYVECNEKGMTCTKNFYVAGDIRAGIKKQIYTAWDSAVDSLDDINSKIRRNNREELLKDKNV